MDGMYKMIYKKTEKDKKIRILGEKFVIRSKHKCCLIFQNKKLSLQKELIVKGIKGEEIKIKILGLNAITDISYLFHGCKSLTGFYKVNLEKYEIKDIEEQNESNDVVEENVVDSKENLNSYEESNSNSTISREEIINGTPNPQKKTYVEDTTTTKMESDDYSLPYIEKNDSSIDNTPQETDTLKINLTNMSNLF